MVPFLLFGAGVAVGLGVAAMAPGLMPQLLRSARPAAKEALKTAIAGYAQARLAVAEAAEATSDLLAEVQHELATAAPGVPPAEAPVAGRPAAAAAPPAGGTPDAAAAAAAARAAALARAAAGSGPGG